MLKSISTPLRWNMIGIPGTTSPLPRVSPIIRQNPKEPVREMSFVRWGLIPSWAKNSSVAATMINARSETANMKPAFRDALKYRRCLIPADAFYEWKRMREIEAAVLFRSQRRRVVRFRRDLGSLEERQWQRSGNLLDSDHNTKRRDRRCPRPYASHPSSGFVRLWLDPGMKDVD